MKKKVLALLTSVALVATMLTACGSESAGAGSKGGDLNFEIIVKSYQSSYWQAAVTGVNRRLESLV